MYELLIFQAICLIRCLEVLDRLPVQFAEVVPHSFHPSGAHKLTAALRLKARVVFEKTK